MKLHDFLAEVHRGYRPRSYLEIGVNHGQSLAVSRTRTIAVDPAFEITWEIQCDVQLVKATSDEFFGRSDGLAHFPAGRIDLAFIDGLHLFEYALRDFMNVERHARWTTVILIDDVLPRNVAKACRDRVTKAPWPGDVFKITEVLTRYRSDLLVLALDTEPTGILLILGADPGNRVLHDRYEEIVSEYVYPDPQRVPEAVLRRETAVEAGSIVHSDLWSNLREARESGLTRADGWDAVGRAVEAAARPAETRELTAANLRPRMGPDRTSRGNGHPPAIPQRAVAAVRRRLQPLRRRVRGLGKRRV